MSDYYPQLPDADMPLSPVAQKRRHVLLGVGVVVLAFLAVSVAGFDPTGVGEFIKALVWAVISPQPQRDGAVNTAADLLVGIGPLLSAATMTAILATLRFRWASTVGIVVVVMMAGLIVHTLYAQTYMANEYQAYRTWYLFALFSSIAGVCGTGLGCSIAYARERM